MATFSENQVNHLYVVGQVVAYDKSTKPNVSSGATAVGDIMIRKNDYTGLVYGEYLGANKEAIRTDVIDPKKILYASYKKADDLARSLKAQKVVLDADPVVGQDYYVRILFKAFASLGEEDTYVKWASAHASTGATKSSIYKDLAISLVRNFVPEASDLIKVFLLTADGKTEVTSVNQALTGTYTGLVIAEKEQPWRRGIMSSDPVDFTVTPSTITSNGEDVEWGTVTDYTKDYAVKVVNGKNIADLEYFLMGERGDQYRGIGFPNNWETEYLVDPTKGYDVVSIHYYTDEANENVQKSEKDITFVCATAEQTTALISAINTAVGSTIISE
jgi:hypothetical protein